MALSRSYLDRCYKGAHFFTVKGSCGLHYYGALWLALILILYASTDCDSQVVCAAQPKMHTIHYRGKGNFSKD